MPEQHTPSGRGWALTAVHQVAAGKMQASVPRFDSGPARHWRTALCDRASREDRTRFWGSDLNRIEICECGRDRAWPTWSDKPTSGWLGTTGRDWETGNTYRAAVH